MSCWDSARAAAAGSGAPPQIAARTELKALACTDPVSKRLAVCCHSRTAKETTVGRVSDMASTAMLAVSGLRVADASSMNLVPVYKAMRKLMQKPSTYQSQ